jgi:hypothetical protein
MLNFDQANEISRADRETAAAILAGSRQAAGDNWLDRLRLLEEIVAGRHDGMSIVQAMARHRLAAELAARRDGIALGLRVAARIVRSHEARARTAPSYRTAHADMEAAILDMSADDILQSPLSWGYDSSDGNDDSRGIRFA